MTTVTAFVELLLGFVPFAVIVLTIVATAYAATKLFPAFGTKVSAVFDALFGVDKNYDHKHKTGYTSHRW